MNAPIFIVHSLDFKFPVTTATRSCHFHQKNLFHNTGRTSYLGNTHRGREFARPENSLMMKLGCGAIGRCFRVHGKLLEQRMRLVKVKHPSNLGISISSSFRKRSSR